MHRVVKIADDRAGVDAQLLSGELVLGNRYLCLEDTGVEHHTFCEQPDGMLCRLVLQAPEWHKSKQEPVLDENGDPVVDKNGDPVTTEVGVLMNVPAHEKSALRDDEEALVTRERAALLSDGEPKDAEVRLAESYEASAAARRTEVAFLKAAAALDGAGTFTEKP